MTSGAPGQRRGVEVPVFGIVLITIGVVALLNTAGAIDTSAWWVMWRLWPLLLVLLGIKVIFGHMPVAAVALIAAAFVGVSVAFAWAVSEDKLLATELVETEYELAAGDFEGLELDLNFAAGKLRVVPLEPGDTRLLFAQFRDSEDTVEVSGPGAGTVAQVAFNVEARGFLPFVGERVRDREWTVYVSRDVPTRIDIDGGAGQFTLDLRDTRVTAFDVSMGAASIEVTAPVSAGHVEGRVGAGASSITVIVPEGVEARIRNSSGVSSVVIDGDRFPETGDVHESAGYETAANRLDLVIDAGASNIRVR